MLSLVIKHIRYVFVVLESLSEPILTFIYRIKSPLLRVFQFILETTVSGILFYLVLDFQVILLSTAFIRLALIFFNLFGILNRLPWYCLIKQAYIKYVLRKLVPFCLSSYSMNAKITALNLQQPSNLLYPRSLFY